MSWQAFPQPLHARVHLNDEFYDVQILFWMIDADGRLWYMTPGGIKIDGLKVVWIP